MLARKFWAKQMYGDGRCNSSAVTVSLSPEILPRDSDQTAVSCAEMDFLHARLSTVCSMPRGWIKWNGVSWVLVSFACKSHMKLCNARDEGTKPCNHSFYGRQNLIHVCKFLCLIRKYSVRKMKDKSAHLENAHFLRFSHFIPFHICMQSFLRQPVQCGPRLPGKFL